MSLESRSSIRKALEDVKNHFKEDILVLINNAAISQEKSFDKIIDDDWDRMRPGHTSHADLSIGNMEISGSYSNSGHAMSRLEDFFQSIKETTVFVISFINL